MDEVPAVACNISDFLYHFFIRVFSRVLWLSLGSSACAVEKVVREALQF